MFPIMQLFPPSVTSSPSGPNTLYTVLIYFTSFLMARDQIFNPDKTTSNIIEIYSLVNIRNSRFWEKLGNRQQLPIPTKQVQMVTIFKTA